MRLNEISQQEFAGALKDPGAHTAKQVRKSIADSLGIAAFVDLDETVNGHVIEVEWAFSTSDIKDPKLRDSYIKQVIEDLRQQMKDGSMPGIYRVELFTKQHGKEYAIFLFSKV